MDNSAINIQQDVNPMMIPRRAPDLKIAYLVILFVFLQVFMLNYLGFMIWGYSISYLLLQFWIVDLCILTILLYLRQKYRNKQGWLIVDTIIAAIYKSVILSYHSSNGMQIQYVSYAIMAYYVIRVSVNNMRSIQNNEEIGQYKYAMQGIKFLLLIQLMLVTMRWSTTISWNWYSIFSLTWGLLVVSFIIHIVILMSLIENIVDFIKKLATATQLLGSLWFTIYAFGFTVFPLFFLLQLCASIQDQSVPMNQMLTLFLCLIAFILGTLVFTVIILRYLKYKYFNIRCYFSDIEPNQEVKKQKSQISEKTLQFVKIDLPYKIVQISATYFDFIQVPVQHQLGNQSKITNNNSSIQKQKLKAFEFMAKTEQINSPCPQDDMMINEEKCTICFDQPPSVVLMPCQHGGICLTCMKQFIAKTQQCPLCREVFHIQCQKIDQFIRLKKNDEGRYSIKDVGLYV